MSCAGDTADTSDCTLCKSSQSILAQVAVLAAVPALRHSRTPVLYERDERTRAQGDTTPPSAMGIHSVNTMLTPKSSNIRTRTAYAHIHLHEHAYLQVLSVKRPSTHNRREYDGRGAPNRTANWRLATIRLLKTRSARREQNHERR